MTDLFLKVLNTSFSAVWLVLGILLARLVLKKAPRSLVCGLWALVALRLIFGGIEAPFSLVPSAEIIPPESLFEQAPAIYSGLPVIDQAVNPVYSESLRPMPGASVNPLQVWLAVFANIWLLGMAVMALWAALSWLRVRRQVRESVPEDGVYLCDRISSPFLFGLIRPKIYLPSCLEGDARSHVIAHEKAHLARRDHWWKPLGFLLLTVNWFNPVMWLAYTLLCRDIELACDERVVRRLPAEEKKAYSSALLQCSLPRRAIAACPLAFGEVGVKQRVRSVLNYRKPTFWVIVTAAVLIGILAVCLLTDPVAETPETEETTHTEPHQDPEADEPNLGISLRLEQITPESATLVCTQDGTPWHEIITGAPWSLQALRDGVWVDLMLEDSFWTAEAYPIPIGESRSFQLDWSRDVGTLEPGFYRIAKTFSGYAQVTLHQSASESVTRTCYAVFEINPLGIHLDVTDVTPGGATLVCTQDGTPWREITTGSEWTLEQLTDGGWVSVLPEDTTWTAISIGVNQNGTTNWNLSWEQIVGELGPGQYRVGKSFLGFGEFTVDGTCALGEGVRQTCCAEFRIESHDAPETFSPELHQAIRDDWNSYEAMSEFDRLASSKTPGFCTREFDSWDMVEQFIGRSVPNPLESLDTLEKGNWAAAPEGFNGGARFYVTFSGSRSGQVQSVTVASGYRRGDIRVSLKAYLCPDDAAGKQPTFRIIPDVGDAFEARTVTVYGGNAAYTLRAMGDPGTGEELQVLLEELLPCFDAL